MDERTEEQGTLEFEIDSDLNSEDYGMNVVYKWGDKVMPIVDTDFSDWRKNEEDLTTVQSYMEQGKISKSSLREFQRTFFNLYGNLVLNSVWNDDARAV